VRRRSAPSRFARAISALWASILAAAPVGAACPQQITYLSDAPGDPYRYLEDQQRQVYDENPGLADPYSLAELKTPRAVANFAELKRRALEACPKGKPRSSCALDPDLVDKLFGSIECITLPTRFESPLFASLIALDSEAVDKVRLTRYPKSPATRFGSLPTGSFDAQAIHPPGSTLPLVILNRDIFFFTGALSKALSDAIPIAEGPMVALDYSEDGIRKRLRATPYIVHNFADAMSRLVREGSSNGAMEITLDETHNHLHARLVTAMDLFLLAHEQAHIVLGHVSDKSVAFRLAGGRASAHSVPAVRRGARTRTVPAGASRQPATSLQAALRTREQEYEADALGLKLLMWSRHEDGDPIAEMVAGAAPHMMFRVLDAANAYGAEAGGWTFGDANHPSAADRIAALAPVFDGLAAESDVLRQVDFRIMFDAAFKVLLEEADPEIRRNLGLAPRAKK